MADLHLSGGDTLPDGQSRLSAGDGGVAPSRAGGSRPWERRSAAPSGATPTSTADRGAVKDPEGAESRRYPTRMARRRALEAAQVLDRWRPDPVLTPQLLQRVGDELRRLFDAPAEASADGREQVVEAEEGTTSAAEEGTTSAAEVVPQPRRRGWRRVGRSGAAARPAPTVVGRTTVVRQDDPVDDAVWFAGLKEMTRAEEGTGDLVGGGEPVRVDDAASSARRNEPTAGPAGLTAGPAGAPEPTRPLERSREASPRRVADQQQIVPAVTPPARRARRPLVAAAVAALVVVSTVVALVLSRGGGDVDAGPAPSVAPQQAVVVALSLSPQAAAAARRSTPSAAKASATAVSPQAGDVTGLSLLAAGGDAAQQVLVPSRLLLDVPGAGRVPMSRSLTGGPDAPARALTDALEIRVDTTWTLDSAALASLVDRVGGVVVDVDTDVTEGTQVGAGVLLGAGPRQKLAGAQAALFAQFLGADEPEASRLARQEQVVRAVLSALPDDPAAIRAVLAELPGAPTGRALDTVTQVVSASRLAAVQDDLASTMLPVKEIDAGGTVSAYGLDDAAARQLVDARLAGAKLPVAAVGHVRVLVQNGVGTPGLGDAARARLLAAGLRYVAGGNVPGFGQKQSVVLLRDASSANRERGMAVARSLGLDESSLRISESAPTVADVVVVLGQDFRP